MNDKNNRRMKIAQNVHMSITRRGFGVAVVSFENDDNIRIDVPDRLLVHDVTNGKSMAHRSHTFLLGWTDDYTISFKGVVICTLSSQRHWAISSQLENPFDIVE